MPFDRGELEHDAVVLKELMHSQGWKVFLKHATAGVESLRELVLTGDKERFDYNKGVYWGAVDTVRIPETVIRLAEQAEKSEKEEKTHANR